MQTHRNGVAVLYRLAVAMLLVVCATTTSAIADDDPPKAAPRGEATAEQESSATKAGSPQAPSTQPADGAIRRPVIAPLQGQPHATATSGCGDKGKPDVPTPSPDGPQPRWVCKQETVTAEAVWSGKNAEFVFEIANEGEADLQIKLKGG